MNIYYLHSIMPVDINKLDKDTYAIEMMADVLTPSNSTYIFLIFIIKYDESIERNSLYINNIRKDQSKTDIYEKLISGKNIHNTFFLDWKFVYDNDSKYYYTDLASRLHENIIEDRLYVTKNTFLQSCIFLSLLNSKDNPSVNIDIFSDDEYRNIKKTNIGYKIPSNTYNIVFNNKLFIIFKSDCIRYIEIDQKKKGGNENDQTKNS